MNKIYLAAITGAALTAVAGIANAQGTGTSSGTTGTASNQCWEVSSNMIRDKNQTNASGTSSTSSENTSSTVGSTSPRNAMGTGAVGAGGPSAGAGTGSSASARPAGMPDC
jgi:hypothetical protein